MDRVWKLSRELEKRGIVLPPEAFGMLIRREWEKAKAEASRVCPVITHEKLEELLKKIEVEETKPLEVKVETGESHEGETSSETSSE
jgi:hypothetical protein